MCPWKIMRRFQCIRPRASTSSVSPPSALLMSRRSRTARSPRSPKGWRLWRRALMGRRVSIASRARGARCTSSRLRAPRIRSACWTYGQARTPLTVSGHHLGTAEELTRRSLQASISISTRRFDCYLAEMVANSDGPLPFLHKRMFMQQMSIVFVWRIGFLL